MYFLEGLFRWIHVVAGVLWIGLLYFFNWVNSSFAPTMDAETKKKVIPELMPRTLFWFRWGAAFTWVTGVLLLFLVYYSNSSLLFPSGNGWGVGAFIMVAVVFLGVFAYDVLVSTVLKEPTATFVGGLVLSCILLFLLDYVAGFGFRGYAIHLGATFGTIMAFNVWFRIWPAQQKIITAIKNGEAPDPALGAVAGTRSKHNTYMSVPLIFLMLSQHETWAASPIYLTIIVLIGWAITYHLYDRAKRVKGF
ncbi:MAG: urate hydroxylase PuuD [Candidatus Binatia bacterium]